MNKSKKSQAILDKSYGIKRGERISRVLSRFVNLQDCRILDIGTGPGYLISEISKKCKAAISVDLYDERIVMSGYDFKRVSDERLPFENESLDVVISSHVIEHVPNQVLHVSEIHRVLKKNGILYLAMPNKYWIIEPHYNLPFVSWLPRKIMCFLVRVIKNEFCNIYPVSLAMLEKISRDKFKIYNLTEDLIKKPEEYQVDMFKPVQPIFKLIPVQWMRFLNLIVPAYIFVLKKI